MIAQSNVISLVIIAGMVIAFAGAAYVWAVPLIEKRASVTEYDTVERFMLELNDKIVSIANTGSGTAALKIPKGNLNLKPYNFAGDVNNTLTLDFYVSQPLIVEGGSVPLKTSTLDYIGEYGNAEPRTILMSRIPDTGKIHLNVTMRYRELRSNVPKGYVIALCPVTDLEGCQNEISGRNSIKVSYGGTFVVPRNIEDGGELLITKISIEAT